MHKLNLDKAIRALDHPARKAIVQFLIRKPMNVKDAIDELSRIGLKPKYRDSVYKNLEKLVASGLVDKFYDNQKGICYRLIKRELRIDLAMWIVE